MAVYVDNFPVRTGNARRARCDINRMLIKIKLRKIREFGSLGLAGGTSRPPAATHELQPGHPGSLWSFNPTNSYSHTIKRSRKPPILQV